MATIQSLPEAGWIDEATREIKNNNKHLKGQTQELRQNH
jgi:hypothetical protein